MTTASLLDVKVDNHLTLREIVQDSFFDGDACTEYLRHLEVWEQTQNRFIDDGKRRELNLLHDRLSTLIHAFKATGNDGTAKVLGQLRSDVYNIRGPRT